MIAQVVDPTMTNPQTNLIDEVTALGSTLAVDQTYRTTCLKCGGGASKERSFSITRTSQSRILYKCFRATCGWGGTIVGGIDWSKEIVLPFEKRLRTLSAPVDKLDENQVRWFRDRFGISPDADTGYCDSKDMYAYKVRGPNQQHRGWQLRSYVPGRSLRADNYIIRDEPFVSWYFPKDKELGGVIVVEDIPSARKVATCGIASVALLGCSIDFERAYEIGANNEGFTILALDRGTLAQALGYKTKYEALWGSVEVWQLDKDLKDVTRQRIRRALYDGATDFISDPDKQE